jgi:hypothetical protein
MIDRFIARGSVGVADEGVGGIVPEGNLFRALHTAEVVFHGLTVSRGRCIVNDRASGSRGFARDP